jgi:uridine phosphorylase
MMESIMEERFTPQESIEHFIRLGGISVEDIGVTSHVVISWGRVMIEEMAAAIDAKKSEHWLYGQRQTFFHGRLEQQSISLVELPVGAPGTVMIMEEMIAAGARTFIGLGWAGSLQPDFTIGSFIIPTSCISEEGTSTHYFPRLPELTADQAIAEALENAAIDQGVPVRTGTQWTTDAPYRELRNSVEKYRELGVLGVDMETSAMYALAQFRGVRVCNLLVVSDVLDSEWKPGFGTARMKIANEIAQKVVLNSIFA